ncbi:MAG: class I SAM-dependent methyltransferase [Candidatus Eremiobacteraeota bacterium]|nr:class I SAM-dependent methyltransferase [Candidatus Eremiobacteraeota bacterium]
MSRFSKSFALARRIAAALKRRIFRNRRQSETPPQPGGPHVAWAVDVPASGQHVAPTGFLLAGWVTYGARQLRAVVARHAGETIGMTAVPHVRDDVIPGARCGYRIFIEPKADCQPGDYEIDVFASFDVTGEQISAGRVTCRLGDFNERSRDYGGLANADYTSVPGRDGLYTVGPPSRYCAPGLVDLLLSYMEPQATVLDVGCGAAPYALPILEAGRHWSGCEVSADLVAENSERGLPVTLVAGSTLPFEDGAFDYAICIEVLEHIEAYEPFVAEIARVARRGACFSVPNVRAIPRLAPYAVVPWHLLEASHVNFFTAVNLRNS